MENHNSVIEATRRRSVGETAQHLRCLHANARRMENKQEELEISVHKLNYNPTAITETSWDKSLIGILLQMGTGATEAP